MLSGQGFFCMQDDATCVPVDLIQRMQIYLAYTYSTSSTAAALSDCSLLLNMNACCRQAQALHQLRAG